MGALALVLAALCLTACTSSIKLRHPDGRQATCGGYFTGAPIGWQAAERERGCIQDYQRQGFEREP
jgi:hypothetical protein